MAKWRMGIATENNMSTFFHNIIVWSLSHKVSVIVIALVVSVAGIVSLLTSKIDVLPDVNKPTVAIFAEADGLASEEIERLIITPIEYAVAGTPGTEKIRSTSSFGIGIVNIEFKWGSDIYRNRQLIQERLAQVVLPEGVKPELGPTTSVMGEIVWIGLTASDPSITGMQLRTLADWTVRPALLRIQGVSNVLVMGGDVKEWQINVDAVKLRRYDMRLEDIIMAVKGALKNRGGGILNQGETEYPIRILVAPSQAKQLEIIAIGKMNDRVVRLGDVARVQELPSIVQGTASVDGKTGVILRIVRQPEAETLKVTKEIDETLEHLKQSFPSGVEVKNDLLRQEWFIHAGLTNVSEALRDATIFLIIILLLFLMNIRITVITLIAIPLSILATAVVLKSFGLSINVMTMGGIAVAIGELVDDAIVSIENIYRRVRENKVLEAPKAHDEVVSIALSEVRNSIVYATLLVGIAFVPVFFIPGVEGKLLAPLGLAYIVSLAASMLVSLTVTPVLCSYFLKKGKQLKHGGDTRFVSLLKRGIMPLLRLSLRHPIILLGIVIFTIGISGYLFLSAGKEGIPPFNERAATAMVILPVGTNLEHTNAFVTTIEKEIMNIPGVQRISHTTGRSSADSHGGGSNSSEIQIAFDAGMEERRKELFKEIQKVFDRYPEAEYSLGQPITHRLEELISGVRAPIVIKVFGDNVGDMKETAENIRNELSRQPGVKNAKVQKDVTVPEFHIYPLPDRLAQYGISPGVVADELEQGLMGEVIGTVSLDNQRIPVVMRYDLASRGNTQSLSDLALPFKETESLSGSAAQVRIGAGRNRYSHEGTKRMLIVSANYQGTDIVQSVENVRQAMFQKRNPIGITISYEGTYKSQKENARLLALLFLAGLVLIFLILWYAFRSAPLVIQIMISIPTVFIGSLIAIKLSGNIISLAHMVGFISLTGIVSRNGIMLIARAVSMIAKEGKEFSEDTIVSATLERVTPVLMTSVVTALALIPLLLSPDKPGKELLHPLALVIFGGLVSSTLLSLFLTPALFYRFGKKTVQKELKGISGF